MFNFWSPPSVLHMCLLLAAEFAACFDFFFPNSCDVRLKVITGCLHFEILLWAIGGNWNLWGSCIPCLALPEISEYLQHAFINVLFVFRVPNRPVINTPIVSATVYTEDQELPQQLQSPVTLKYRLFVTEERTKPLCVFWNHTLA